MNKGKVGEHVGVRACVYVPYGRRAHHGDLKHLLFLLLVNLGLWLFVVVVVAVAVWLAWGRAIACSRHCLWLRLLC